LLGSGVAVGRGTGVSEGVAVTSGCEEGSLQALIIMERIKMKDDRIVSLLDRFMGSPFLRRAFVNYQ